MFRDCRDKEKKGNRDSFSRNFEKITEIPFCL